MNDPWKYTVLDNVYSAWSLPEARFKKGDEDFCDTSFLEPFLLLLKCLFIELFNRMFGKLLV